MASATNSQAYGAERVGPWQERLNQHCADRGIRLPVYQIASDRRGGRTAWSSTVEVEGRLVPARFWYDGQYVHNAREDAAEVAYQKINNGTLHSPTGTPAQPQNQQQQQQQHQHQQQHQQSHQNQAWQGYQH
ncbi:hypothetical protein EJ08DRAFT_449117 [Tothia fuscella]|uniref:DRBM domain-containing protein n=1 Tax=Tothia fuscella TaxID=1048955 RepID=A0A9P4NJB6_9PEZI|nr:hypothetical protein EJ08DRAFT_449117 [Tothia fuscella]